MELPEWAKRALVFVNTVSERDVWQSTFARHISEQWFRLEVEKWRVPENDLRYLQGHFDKELTPADLVRKRILETALDLAWDRAYDEEAQRGSAADAIKAVRKMNGEIADLADKLANLFRARDELMEVHALDDSYEFQRNDPFKFWDAFELSMNAPSFREWRSRTDPHNESFLRIARSQSRPRPQWPDLLSELTKRPDCEVFSDDPVISAVASSRTNNTEWSRLGLQLIAALDDWPGTYRPGFLLDCLPYEQMAALAAVVFEAPEDAFSGEQMRKLRGRHQKRLAAKLADDSSR